MENFSKITADKIHVGVCFSEPVYFDDGKNMFLAAGKTAKAYHIIALKQWKIPYLLTNGTEIDPSDFVSTSSNVNTQAESIDTLEDVESLEDAEELEDVEEL